jgi:DNA-binding CsgD family transcriptional regulator
MRDIPVKLSKRQKQLFGMLEKGMSNKEIADQLELSEHTIKVHFWRLFRRINVTSRGQALKWWHDNQPTGLHFALRAAFDAACRMSDHLKTHGQTANIEEFEHHRAAVLAMEGAPA